MSFILLAAERSFSKIPSLPFSKMLVFLPSFISNIPAIVKLTLNNLVYKPTEKKGGERNKSQLGRTHTLNGINQQPGERYH